MVNLSKTLLKETRQLPAAQKLRLIETLLEELDISDPAIDKAWGKEADLRLKRIEQGKGKLIPVSQIFGKK